MNGDFIGVVIQKMWRFLETETAQSAARVHVPRSGRILRLFAEFVRHNCERLEPTISARGRSRIPLALAASDCDRRLRRNREIDLSFKSIDADHEHAHLIAHAEALAGSSANQSSLRWLKYIKVLRK
jgi:hypothetical protein